MASSHRRALEDKGSGIRLQAVEGAPAEGRGRPAIFIPYQFEASNKITKEHKLLLAFDALMSVRLAGA